MLKNSFVIITAEKLDIDSLLTMPKFIETDKKLSYMILKYVFLNNKVFVCKPACLPACMTTGNDLPPKPLAGLIASILLRVKVISIYTNLSLFRK